MLERPAKQQNIIMLHINANLTLGAFGKKAGWPSLRAIRCRWQAFFSTSASFFNKTFCNV
jgi:hypothetical protein